MVSRYIRDPAVTLGSIKKLNAFLHPGTTTTKSNAPLHPTLMQSSYGTRNGVLPSYQQSNVDAMVVAGRIQRQEHRQERLTRYCKFLAAYFFIAAVVGGIYAAIALN